MCTDFLFFCFRQMRLLIDDADNTFSEFDTLSLEPTKGLHNKRVLNLPKHLLHSPNGLTDPLKRVLLAVEAPSLGNTLLTPSNTAEEVIMENLLKIGPADTLNTRPLVRQGGVKRKLVRAVSRVDPNRNLDILLETNPEPVFASTEERRASDCRTKADNIKRAAVCSLYLQQREKSLNSTSSESPTNISPQTPLFTPSIPKIRRIRESVKKEEPCIPEYEETENFSSSNLTRSRSFAPKRRFKSRAAPRTNSCLGRYICLPDMSVREEIKWARRSIKLYREFSQLSNEGRTDSFLNLDAFFSDDFDEGETLFNTVVEEETMSVEGSSEESETSEEDEMETNFDYLCSLSSLYRTTCPYKRFGETKLLFPFGVSCNETGDVFVSDWEAGMIYQLENIEDELTATTVFPRAFGMCAIGQDVYVTSEEDQHLYLIRPDSPEKLDLGHFLSPDGICFMNGCIYVVEEKNGRVCGLTNTGDIFTFGDDNGLFTMNKPGGVSVYPEKELLLVCDRGNKRISLWDGLGNPVDTIPLPQHPDCCCYAGYGILVVGTSHGEVLFVDLDSKQHVFTWTSKQLKYPGFITGIAVDNRQNVYLCDPKNHRVIKVYR